jgi:SAM-dependent methyltransferase
MHNQTKKYYEYANDSYKLFTPDFLESKKLDIYLESNRESLVDFLEKYQEQFGSFDKSAQILEAGCGLGGLSFYLSKMGFYTHGVDQSKLAISMAREINKNKSLYAKFTGQDLCNSEASEQFDIVVDSHLLHCLVDKNDRESYLAFVKNSLTDDGLFFLETMCYQAKIQIPIGYEFDASFKLYKEIGDEKIPYRKIIDSIELEQELKSMGFKIKYLYYHNELSFDVFSEYKDLNAESLPKTIRLVASK